MNSFRYYLNPWVLGVGGLAVLLAAPVVFVLSGLFTPAGPAWNQVVKAWMPSYAANSLLLLVGASGLALVCGTVPAWVVSVYRFPGRRLFEWLLVLPLALPAYISAYAYAGLFDYSGAIPQALGAIMPEAKVPRIDIMNIYGAIGVMGFGLYPYVYLSARACFTHQSAASLEVARALGQTPLQAFFSVVLPLARPALVGGVLLVGMEVLNEYGAVKYFGVDTFTTGIFVAWFSLGDADAAIRLAAYLLGVVFGFILLERLMRRQRRYTSGRSDRPLRRQELGLAQGAAAFGLCLLPVLCGFLLPAGQLLAWSLATADSLLRAQFWHLVFNSFALATLAALLAVTAALLLVYTLRLYGQGWVKAVARVATVGYAVPGAVIAVGVMLPLVWLDGQIDKGAKAWLGISTGLLLSGTLVAVSFAYLVRFLTVAFNGVEAGFVRVSPHVEEAARSLGAGPLQILLRIDIPLVRTALLSAGLLVFVDVLKELPLTLILRPFNFDTLATRTYELAGDELVAQSANAALVIVATGLVPLVVLNRLIGRERP